MAEAKIRIYLSACISNAPNNEFICDKFPLDKFIFDLPQKITPNQLNHENFPLQVYQQCVNMMEASDIGLLLLDSYGRDCAWEAGWYSAKPDKKLIAFVESSSHFTRDWMIKGGIDIFITTNPRIYTYALQDPVLKFKKIIFLDNIEHIAEKVLDAIGS
jgi:hypothetical protein